MTESSEDAGVRQLRYAFALAIHWIVGVGSVIAGVGAFGWQVYHWLAAGEWRAISLLAFFKWADFESPWAESPDTWLGLWKLLNWMPFSVSAVILGAFVIAIISDDIAAYKTDSRPR